MRLIDADALKRHKQLEAFGNGKYEDVEIVYATDIDNAPTIDCDKCIWSECNYNKVDWMGTSADVAPVVRCKDCKCWAEWANGTGSCSRFALDWIGTDADDFCSMGERKGNEID